jgi:DNA (cytosine-5)-methyltransferase 1
MTHASLFSGIGGFDLAAEWIGWDNIFHCEWNHFGQRVLAHHFPNSQSYNDITKTDFSIHSGKIDVLTGGFPCQPYSTAGLRKGKTDERHLFPEMLRAIKEIKPKWVIGENVRGLVSWGGGVVFNEVCDDLEREGYEVQPFLIPAASVNAPHQRQRIWFVAYSNYKGRSCELRKIQKENGEISQRNNNAKFSNTNNVITYNSFSSRRGKNEWVRNRESNINYKIDEKGIWSNFPTKPTICGGNDGIPRELESTTFPKWRKESIKAYGNAIVPQVAYEIFKAIQSFEDLVNV